ncbi:MAG: GTP cyclohydrolase I FolE [Fidelibacterota bacterium]
MNKDNEIRIQELTAELLKEIGEDPSREGLVRTPERVARAWEYFIRGYQQTPDEVVGDALFDEDVDEIVVVKDIDFFSLCEHHLLPFKGVVHVGYLPGKKIIGLSKIPRIIIIYARRLQVQERMTQQIADAIEQVLNPRGVAVIVEAEHLCMQMRGVEKKASFMITSAIRGVFRENQKTREEFLSIIRRRGN